MKVIELSDVKKFIKKLKSLGIEIARGNGNLESRYNHERRLIFIARGRHREISYLPLVWLFHEGGHALVDPRVYERAKDTDILARLTRYRNNHRYSRVVGELLDLHTTPSSLRTGMSHRILVKTAFRKVRKLLFIEKLANTEALKYMPETFATVYNYYAVKAYRAYRQKLIDHRFYDEFVTSSNIAKITEKHYF